MIYGMNIGMESDWRELRWRWRSRDFKMGINNLAFDYDCLDLNPIWIFSSCNRGNIFLLLFLSPRKFMIIYFWRLNQFLKDIYNSLFRSLHIGAIAVGNSNDITLCLAMFWCLYQMLVWYMVTFLSCFGALTDISDIGLIFRGLYGGYLVEQKLARNFFPQKAGQLWLNSHSGNKLGALLPSLLDRR